MPPSTFKFVLLHINMISLAAKILNFIPNLAIIQFFILLYWLHVMTTVGRLHSQHSRPSTQTAIKYIHNLLIGGRTNTHTISTVNFGIMDKFMLRDTILSSFFLLLFLIVHCRGSSWMPGAITVPSLTGKVSGLESHMN